MLSEYDPFLKKHLKNHGNCGSGCVNYFSSIIYEELIEEIEKAIHEEIIRRIKVAKIYSVSIDGTKDRNHKNQTSVCIQYVEIEKPVERFIRFLENLGHKAIEMFQGLTNFSDEIPLILKMCGINRMIMLRR